MRTATFQYPSYLKGIQQIERQLDSTNVKILSAMWTHGPRNLLRVSRLTHLPFTTVYHRVAMLEAKTGRIAYSVPETSKLGMMRVLALVSARAGSERLVTEAIKIPNLWRFINPCEGTFTHLSAHTVPVKYLKDFKRYMRRLHEVGLANEPRLILTGDYIPNFPDFRSYDPKQKRWRFRWEEWLSKLRKSGVQRKLKDPEDYPLLADKRDLLIVKELEKNSRISFADLAPKLGITLQGVKYRYDKRLVRSGIIRHFAFDVYPYPVEISAGHEVMLEFTGSHYVNRFFSTVNELFFISGVAKVLRQNAIVARTYIPDSQVPNMLSFFSEMARTGILETYSTVRLGFAGRETQTISYELFDDEKGWTFDLADCLVRLGKLTRTKKALAS